jgi:hypothetical protein
MYQPRPLAGNRIPLKAHYGADIAASNITPQQDAAHHAYFGGRIELLKQGYIENVGLHCYDIASAYPAGMVALPSLAGGKWINLPGSDIPTGSLAKLRMRTGDPTTQPDGRRYALQADPFVEQIVGDLRLMQHPPIGPETHRSFTPTKPGPLWPGQNADRPPVPRYSWREATAGFLHGGGQFGDSKHA